MSERIPCSACSGAYEHYRASCPECHGVGYHERSTCTAGKDWKRVCPVRTDLGTGGWECSKCGESGPW